MAEKLTSKERVPRHALWDHLQEQHGLVLLESEIDDIIALARATLPPDDHLATIRTALAFIQRGVYGEAQIELLAALRQSSTKEPSLAKQIAQAKQGIAETPAYALGHSHETVVTPCPRCKGVRYIVGVGQIAHQCPMCNAVSEPESL